MGAFDIPKGKTVESEWFLGLKEHSDASVPLVRQHGEWAGRVGQEPFSAETDVECKALCCA